MCKQDNALVKIELYTSCNTHLCKDSGTGSLEKPPGILRAEESHAELVLHLLLPCVATSLLIGIAFLANLNGYLI